MRKLTSEVWNHFKREGKWAICQHCRRSFSGSSNYGTTHLRNHLNSKICKKKEKEKISSSETDGLENPIVTNGNFVFDEEWSGLDLLRMVIKNGYPLSMVEHEDFKIFVKNLQPMFKLPSLDTLKDKILCFYREEKEKLLKQFDKVFCFSLILNFWTDCGKKSMYCSFTLQFIEDGPKLKKQVIALKNVEYYYTGNTLFEIVKGALLEWNIDKKLATITVESSFANDQMVDILQSWLEDRGNCNPFRKQIFHIPCITHIINLLVKDGLDEIDYILFKIRKAFKDMSVKTFEKQKFEEVVKKLNLGGKEITSEGVPLRWDSTFFMLQIALELRRQAQDKAYVDTHSIYCVNIMNLSTEEWDKAKVVHKCFTVFYDAIRSFFGSKCLSTYVYFRKIFDIFESLNQWQESDIAKKMKVNFDKNFPLVSFASAIVAVFDPRTKLDFVEYSLKRYYGDTSKQWRTLSEDLANMFDFYDKYHTSKRSSSSFINNDNSSSSDGDDTCNILDDWKKSKRQKTELEKYIQEPLQPDEEFDILGWWHTKSQDSTTLWMMAHDILAIPMSTSTSNSAFCTETMTLEPIFNDLDPDIIEALFCVKDWLDNPIRITPNKDNDHSTANSESMLEISGSTSGLERPLPFGDTSHVWSGTLAPEKKHDPSNADTELMLANGSATSRPKPLPLPTKEVNKMKRPEISESYKVTSAPPNSSKKRKSTSDVWNHFIKETDQNGMVWAKCKDWGKPLSGLSKDGTTHSKNQLNSLKCKRSQKETGGLENPTVTNENFVFDEERSGLDLVRMIIKNGYPLNMVEHEDFKIFMKNLQPMFKLPSQDTLIDKILCFYREEKEKLREQFDKVLSFSLILNFWTDCGKQSKYCSFTLQFIEDGPKLKKNIAIKNVEYNYTGETLFEVVKVVLLEWNIDKKLDSITVESSYANDQMVKILNIWLGDQGNCQPFRKLIFPIPCITHVINLLVKDGLDEIDYFLHKVRKAIKYMSETAKGRQKFEEVVKKLNLEGKDITSEGVFLRWDSTFFMLRIALELRRQGEAFVDLQSSNCVFPMNLSVEEWDKAKVVHKCLTVFYDAICSFFGSKGLSPNVYFSKIFDIYFSLGQWSNFGIANKMAQQFACFFVRVNYLYGTVAVFDPRTKFDFVKYPFKEYFDRHSKRLNKKYLGIVFNLYAEYLTSQRSSSSSINNDNSCNSDGDNGDNSYSSDGDHPCNILDAWKKRNRRSTELEKYLKEPLEPDEEFDILGWWHTKSQDSPTLGTMARDSLAIPMSTSTSNSAFCIETMTLDPIFNDLDPDVIEALFCGKDWLDNPIKITSNKDNDHSIANPEPMLENPGSTSGPEPLQTGDTLHVWSGTLEPQEKHDLSNADTELMPANCSATSCPKQNPLPIKEFGLVDEEIMNVFKPYTEIEKIICNYIFNEDLDGSEVLVDMKYEFGERAAFKALLPNQWITDEIINLVICKVTKEKRFSKIHAWYLPTRFSQRMMHEDGNPTLSWFKKSFRDNDKYMSKLVNCNQIFIPMNDNDRHWYLCVVELIPNKCIYILDSLPSTTKQDIRKKDVKTVVTGLDKLLSYLEKDNYNDSITKFALKSPPSNPRQNNGYDCGMYVIKHLCTNMFNFHLPFLEGELERFRYKLAANLVLSKDNQQRSNIIERAKKIPLKDYFLSLK